MCVWNDVYCDWSEADEFFVLCPRVRVIEQKFGRDSDDEEGVSLMLEL